MKTYQDPISRINYSFEEKEVISVYLRRNNGKKRLIFSSLSPSRSFDLYHNFKIFKGDVKYLETNLKDMSRRIFFQKGVDLPPTKLHKVGRKREINYKTGIIPGITNIPMTLINDINTILKSQVLPGTSNKLTRNKLIPVLLSYYVSLSEEERKILNGYAFSAYATQRMKSGGNFTQGCLDSTNYEDDEELL